MADHTQRWEDNVAGRWYVDRTCILCSLCSELAPRSFKESTDGDHDIVYRQPATPEEEAAAELAKAQCPVESIGRDG
jgi:ferredoxin